MLSFDLPTCSFSGIIFYIIYIYYTSENYHGFTKNDGPWEIHCPASGLDNTSSGFKYSVVFRINRYFMDAAFVFLLSNSIVKNVLTCLKFGFQEWRFYGIST